MAHALPCYMPCVLRGIRVEIESASDSHRKAYVSTPVKEKHTALQALHVLNEEQQGVTSAQPGWWPCLSHVVQFHAQCCLWYRHV